MKPPYSELFYMHSNYIHYKQCYRRSPNGQALGLRWCKSLDKKNGTVKGHKHEMSQIHSYIAYEKASGLLESLAQLAKSTLLGA